MGDRRIAKAVACALVLLPLQGMATTAAGTVHCTASLVLRGHQNGVDKPAECGQYVEDGPSIAPVSPTNASRSDATVRHREAVVNLQFSVTDGGVVGVIRARPPSRDTFSSIARGTLVVNGDPSLALSAYLNEKSVPEKPECGFSQYVNVTCVLR